MNDRQSFDYRKKIAQICARKEIYFSKNQAAKFIGSREKLENLCASGMIRYTKGGSQNSKWMILAEDVFNNI